MKSMVQEWTEGVSRIADVTSVGRAGNRSQWVEVGGWGSNPALCDPLAWIPLTVMVLWDIFRNQKIIEGPIIFC